MLQCRAGSLSAGGYHWFKRVITGRKNTRLEEVMKINESSDTKIVGMHHTKGRTGEYLKESWIIKYLRGQCVRSNFGRTAFWCRRHVSVAVDGRCESRK